MSGLCLVSISELMQLAKAFDFASHCNLASYGIDSRLFS